MPSGERNKRNSSVEEFDIFWGVKCAVCVYKSRAETHERFYMIEAHRHRFEMFARKVPFEKRTRWRKACGRSAKDQIGDIYLLNFFYDFERKVREDARKTYPLEPCPAQKGLHLAMPDIGPREKKQHITMTFWLLRVCLIFDSRYEFLILENATLYGTAKGGERFAKDLRKGGFLGTFIGHNFHIYIWIYIYVLYIHEPP